jgi:GT2 family glycosyltransferase
MPAGMREKLRIVCATRETPERFFAETALGRSLAVYNFPRTEIRLHANNARGLPSIYNEAIAEAAADPAVLVFVHDDIHLCDFYWGSHVFNALQSFEVVGLAGNRRRVPRQPAWAFVDDRFTWDAKENLSGIVGHGKGFPPQNLSVFGPPGQAVKLLDGLLLAVRSQTLISRNIRFDERFAFHFYDLDFCRQCEQQGVRMGTWSISVVHESAGNFSSPAWKAGYERYLAKWGD